MPSIASKGSMSGIGFGLLNSANSSLFLFTSFTFTNCNITGRTGPALANCQSTYAGQSWLSGFFNVNNGIQAWTVPETGSYLIKARGANGASATNNSSSGITAGRGIILQATFALTKGDVIKMLVGQAGGASAVNGGGGGGNREGASGAGIDGSSSNFGLLNSAGNGASVASAISNVANNTGSIGGYATLGGPGVSGANSYGNAGAGYNGPNPGIDGVSGGIAAVAYVNGGTGGGSSDGSNGGFGGGGSGQGNNGGGGGGGYTGGNGGWRAGGGGSYFSASANLTSTTFDSNYTSQGGNVFHGYVSITKQ